MVLKGNLPSDKRFGVLDAPSPICNSAGLAGGGVCILDPDGFLLLDIGADIDGRRFTKLNGRPSSESRSPVAPKEKKKSSFNTLPYHAILNQ